MTDTGILLNNQMADFADPENPDTKDMTVIQNYLSLTESDITAQLCGFTHYDKPMWKKNIGRTKISSYP